MASDAPYKKGLPGYKSKPTIPREAASKSKKPPTPEHGTPRPVTSPSTKKGY